MFEDQFDVVLKVNVQRIYKSVKFKNVYLYLITVIYYNFFSRLLQARTHCFHSFLNSFFLFYFQIFLCSLHPITSNIFVVCPSVSMQAVLLVFGLRFVIYLFSSVHEQPNLFPYMTQVPTTVALSPRPFDSIFFIRFHRNLHTKATEFIRIVYNVIFVFINSNVNLHNGISLKQYLFVAMSRLFTFSRLYSRIFIDNCTQILEILYLFKFAIILF